MHNLNEILTELLCVQNIKTKIICSKQSVRSTNFVWYQLQEEAHATQEKRADGPPHREHRMLEILTNLSVNVSITTSSPAGQVSWDIVVFSNQMRVWIFILVRISKMQMIIGFQGK